MWHSTSIRQPLSSRPHAAKDQLCDFGELTNITSPAGIPFWREGDLQGRQAAARLASESTCHQLLACDLPVSGLGYQQRGFLYLTARETFGEETKPLIFEVDLNLPAWGAQVTFGLVGFFEVSSSQEKFGSQIQFYSQFLQISGLHFWVLGKGKKSKACFTEQ